jgi:uncharacterized protein (DUF1778 family)
MPKGGKREGAGLKPQGDEPITETLAIRVTKSEKQLIKHKAHKRGKSVGRYIVSKIMEDDV